MSTPDEWPSALDVITDGLLAGTGGVVALPFDVPDSDVRLLPGREERESGAAILAAAEVLNVCVPWCTGYIVPRIERAGRPVAGTYSRKAGVVAVAVGRGVVDARLTAHHEAWHAAEVELDDGSFAEVDAAAARGRQWPGEYLSSAVERRARLYASWAAARDEGWSPACIEGVPVLQIDRIFNDLYSGRLAELVAEREAADARAVAEQERRQARRETVRRVGRRLLGAISAAA